MRSRLLHIVKKTRIMILFLLLLITVNSSFSQVNNLVPNGDFEYYTICPNSLSLIDYAYPWTQPNILESSSDYYNICNNFTYPNFFSDYPPRSGNGFAGLIPLNFYISTDYREYISARLQISLIQSKNYCAKFYVKKFSGNIIIDAFGIFFSSNFITQPPGLMLSLLYPAQVKNLRGNMLADTANWMKIMGSFIAQGGEQYLTIGNFEVEDSITRVYLSSVPTSCYYGIDDVSVCDCDDFKPKLGRDTTLCAGQQLLLKANIPKEADSVIYTWQDGSKDSTFMVTQPGTYWVSAYIEDYKITVTDSIRVNYTECNTPQLWIPNSFTPNGDGLNDKFEYGNAENYEIKTTIYNRWGQHIFEGENSNFWDGKYKGKIVTLGIYTYRIDATDKANKEKKIHCGRITVVD